MLAVVSDLFYFNTRVVSRWLYNQTPIRRRITCFNDDSVTSLWAVAFRRPST